jgi:ribose transport system permease protein
VTNAWTCGARTSFTGDRVGMYGTLIGAIIIRILDKGLNQSGVHFKCNILSRAGDFSAGVY